MGIRRALVAAGVVIALLVVLLLRQTHDSDAPAKSPPQTVPAPVAAPQPAATPAPAQVALPTEPAPARPQPVPLPEGANPPPLDGKHSDPAPPQKQLTAEETIAKREADLKLLDNTRARLEEQLAAARSAHDAATAHDLEIRISRLKDLRKKRGDELDKLRAGGSAQP